MISTMKINFLHKNILVKNKKGQEMQKKNLRISWFAV